MKIWLVFQGGHVVGNLGWGEILNFFFGIIELRYWNFFWYSIVLKFRYWTFSIFNTIERHSSYFRESRNTKNTEKAWKSNKNPENFLKKIYKKISDFCFFLFNIKHFRYWIPRNTGKYRTIPKKPKEYGESSIVLTIGITRYFWYFGIPIPTLLGINIHGFQQNPICTKIT